MVWSQRWMNSKGLRSQMAYAWYVYERKNYDCLAVIISLMLGAAEHSQTHTIHACEVLGAPFVL